jgi:hypothetical protein
MQFINEVEANPLTLAQASKKVPGRKRNPSTLWRWGRHGKQINGITIKLEVLEVGRDLLTTEPAMRRFYQRCTQARQLESSPPQSSSSAHAAAETELDEMGM